MDELVEHLHLKHGMKCVIFIFDEHILKAGEIHGAITFAGYNFLDEQGKPSKIQVYSRIGEAEKEEFKNEFIVHRRGLYVCGEDHTEIIKR